MLQLVLAVSAAVAVLASAEEGKPTSLTPIAAPLALVRPKVAPIAAPADPKDLQGSESAYYPYYAYPHAYPYAHPYAHPWYYGYPYAYVHG